MEHSGLEPYYRKQTTDFSFYNTFKPMFGATERPKSFTTNSGLWNPNQNTESMPTGCTEYTVYNGLMALSRESYAKGWNFAQTLRLMNKPATWQGADLKIAYSIPVAVGKVLRSEAPDGFADKDQGFLADYRNWPKIPAAENRKEGRYFFVYDSPKDWFDDICDTIWQNWITNGIKEPVGLGTPWYYEYGGVGSDGIMPEGSNIASWHAYSAEGWTVIDGVEYLECLVWQGTQFGFSGIARFSRTQINQMMNTIGSVAITYALIDPKDIRAVQWSLKERLLGLMQALIHALNPYK